MIRSHLNIFFVILTLIALAYIEPIRAVPAKGGVITVQQPDGTELNIILNGDEFFSWRTTESGYPITRGEDGYYYYASYSAAGTRSATSQRVSIAGVMQSPPSGVSTSDISSIAQRVSTQQRTQNQSVNTKSSSSGFPSQGTVRSVVLLVEFSDVSFTVSDPNTAFHNQLNQSGYSVEGATGSAKDYFDLNSRGTFDGNFDVYGPYTLENERSYYGGNDDDGYDLRPDQMVWDAVKLADDDIDFSQYDFDNNGYIDNIFVYYAGHNEAEGASEDTIWPHMWAVSSQPQFDGKRLYVYACTSELRDSRGSTIAGIGTFCHEFSHVFGLADHYDTNGTTNGSVYGLGYYDIMSSGSYNNNGNTPPLHNGLELEMIGWHTPTVIESSQSITIKPIAEGEVYKILTEVEDEYFLIENRYKSTSSHLWDSYIAADGLFITHVDRSEDYIDRWDYYNTPNAYSAHDCFKFVVAGNVTLAYQTESQVPYPSMRGNDEWTSTSSPAALSWGGKELEFNIVNIEQQSNGDVTFLVTYASESVSLVIDCSSEDIFVGEVYSLTPTLYPDPGNFQIAWAVSDSSNVTYEVDQNRLNFTFTSAGTATFTATYQASNGEKYSSSITITAKELQGAAGYVLDIDDQTSAPIAQASIDIYPVTRNYDSSGVLTLSRSTSTATYQTTSDENGAYIIELDEGYYEAEVEASGYVSIFKLFEIKAGENIVNFEMNSYAAAIEDIKVEAAQNSAIVTWNPLSYSAFKVEITDSSGNTVSYTCSEPTLTVENLEAAQEYQVMISAYQNKAYAQIYSTTFTTLQKLTSYPLIHLESYEYSIGEVLELKTLNTEDGDSVSWWFDGTQLQINKVTLDGGEHTIQAVIERDRKVYRVHKKIYVQ
ncbi:MAG: M6 family metalloprotease domain-containing protein [Rikenellaceae bacterium]